LKKIFLIITVLIVITSCNKEKRNKPVSITLWIETEDSSEDFDYTENLIKEFSVSYPHITVITTPKSKNVFHKDFRTAAEAGMSPDLLWCSSDKTALYADRGLIQPVEKFVEVKDYLNPLKIDENIWTVPTSTGNHLLLMVNRKFIKEIPLNSNSLINMAIEAEKQDVYGLLYNKFDSLWLIPWFSAYGGNLYKKDKVTPNLDSYAMKNTLRLLKDLSYLNKTPRATDFLQEEELFRQEKASMIITGDWAIKSFIKSIGDNLLIGRIPKLSATGIQPSPFDLQHLRDLYYFPID